MIWPFEPLDIHVQIKPLGEWIDLGPMAHYVDDFLTDYLLDVLLGRVVWDGRRLPAQDITITQGKPDESSSANPAQVSVLLWNPDGFLTTKDPRSPWWPGWDQNCGFRILVGETVVFEGEVSEAPLAWPQGDLSDMTLTEEELLTLGGIDQARLGFCFVQVTANGILRRIGQGQRALRSPLQRLVTKSNNVAHVSDYWPMEDGSDSGFIASGLPSSTVPTPYRMSFRNDLSLASDDTLPGSESLPSVSAGQTAVWASTVRGEAGYSSGFSVELFYRIPQAPTVSTEWVRLIDLDCSGTIARWALEVGFGTAPFMRVVTFDAAGVQLELSSVEPPPEKVWTEEWHQLRLDLSPGSGVDWAVTSYAVTEDDDTSSGFLFSGNVPGTMGLPTTIRGAVAAAPAGGVSLGHLIIHDGIVGGWLVGADVGYLGELALSRMNRLCLEENIPFTFDRFEPGETTPMGRQRAGMLTDLMDQCVESDAGILCEQRDALGLHYRTRRSLYNAEPVITLDAAESEIANPFEPTNDDQTTRNDITVERIEGSKVNKIDDASAAPPPAGHGAYEQSYSLSLDSDYVLHHHAGWRLHLGTFEGLRYPQVTIDLAIAGQNNAALWDGEPIVWDGEEVTWGDVSLLAQWLALRVGDRVRIINLPPQHPRFPYDYIDLIFQGWSETPSPFGWTVTANCSPASLYDVGRWEESRWSLLGSFLQSGVDADDTSLSVSFPEVTYNLPSGPYTPKWTTNDAHMPLDFLIGGCERVTVTDVSGSSAPQTFAVTRNVNGLGRAHAAGATVELWAPAILGL